MLQVQTGDLVSSLGGGSSSLWHRRDDDFTVPPLMQLDGVDQRVILCFDELERNAFLLAVIAPCPEDDLCDLRVLFKDGDDFFSKFG